VAPNGRVRREPRISTTVGLIASIAVTALAGLGVLIVLLLGAFRTQPTSSAGAQPAPASTVASPTASGALASPFPSPVEVVVVPTAITVNIADGNSGLPEWSPILVAVIGVFGAVGSAFITYFVQRGNKESNHND
jgi:hypothetical protein